MQLIKYAIYISRCFEKLNNSRAAFVVCTPFVCFWKKKKKEHLRNDLDKN